MRKSWLMLAPLLLFAGPVGCHTMTVYDGSEKFYEERPDLDPDLNMPAYMHPAENGTMDRDSR